MKTPARFVIICFLSIVAGACSESVKPAAPPDGGTINTPTPIGITSPTEIALPADLSRASTMLRWMASSGLRILSVQHSLIGAYFHPNQAAYIETDRGIVEIVFFFDPTETDHIVVTLLPNDDRARYPYKIQAAPPIMSHDVRIDAQDPIYFTVERGMFIQTYTPELDQTVKRILAEH